MLALLERGISMVKNVFITVVIVLFTVVVGLFSVFLLLLKLILVMLLFIWIIVLLAVRSLVRMIFSNGENFDKKIKS